ncbi:DUF1893 domain-containing protein [uncultured Sanguibacteroides sp.]|uniref:DUF1893 domain-containing protein n=1 Tax=uncultured Sanguibacteroides sp. TaxID=1635151 RepID=UPI0025D5DE72|nr:DUF1893 domain-containing protein [uncultured Sanguibacteroides sp.]
MTANLIHILHSGKYSCVIANNGSIRTFKQPGIADLYDLLQQDVSFLQGAIVADKVVGKAAATLMILGNIQQVYADIISQSALELLQNTDIQVDFGQLVPFIENRDKTGWCPLESACFEIKSTKDIFPIIQNFISNIRK